MTTLSSQPPSMAETRRSRHSPLAVAAGVLAVFLSLTWWLWHGAHRVADERARATLKYEASLTSNRIERRMAMYEQVLRGVRGMFAASTAVDRQQFRRYITELEIERQLPGIRGIGYAQLVPASERSTHIAKIRAEGFADYAIWPDTARDIYAPIVFMEPFSGGNLKVFGFDPYSVPQARSAMDSARDLDAVISPKLRLQQDDDLNDAAGFVMYLPVYRAGSKPGGTRARRSDIVGWVDAPFNMKELMAGIDKNRPSNVAYSIHDGSEISPRTLMFASNGYRSTGGENGPGLRYQQRMKIGGREWTLLASPLPGASHHIQNELPRLIAILGVALSLLLAWLGWLLATGRQRALAAARDMTIDLRDSEARLHAIIENAAVSIITVDATGTVESMNIAALRSFGYEADEVVGRNIRMLVPEAHRQHHDAYLANYLVTGVSGIFDKGREVTGARKDGSIFPMHLVVSEMSIHGHRAFTAIVRDITLRKQAEAGLAARSEALARANSELTRFAEVSAHHLVEPIRRLGSYAQRLRVRLAQVPQCEADEEIRISIDTLENDAARLRSLVRDIERYIASGIAPDTASMIDANEVLKSIRQHFSHRFDDTGARLEVTPLPAVHIDRKRLSVLFSVLIENALQHARPVDPDIALAIRISGERIGNLSRYRVEDNGTGIPEQYSDRMFNIFERIGAGSESTGIGLSIARRIVESRHGRIWIDGVSAGGVVVFFEIPDGAD